MGPHAGYLLSKMPCLTFNPCTETSNPSTVLRRKDDSWKASSSEVYLHRGETNLLVSMEDMHNTCFLHSMITE